MTKTFILDTNVLLHDPNSLFTFEDNEIVLPMAVLDELDKKKNGVDEVARHARMAIRSLDEIRIQGSIHEGVKISNGGTIKVELNFHDKCPLGLDPTRMDNRIIGVALGLREQAPEGHRVVVVSKDINLRVKCDALGVDVEDYNADSVAESADLLYAGTAELAIDDALVDQFHRDELIAVDDLGAFLPNQYVHLKSLSNPKKTGLARFEKNVLIKIKTYNNIWGISSRNKEQAFALDALFNPNIKLVTMTGRAGTGKTLLAAAASISQLFDSHTYKKMIMTRPVQPMGKDIGFLPGTMEEKMAPWMAPLQDNLELLFSDKGANFLEMQQEAGIIEVEALTYIRGRSIPKTIMIVDEAQNLTSHEIKTIITRVGDDSKIILTGDIMQIDSSYLDSVDNGLSYVIEKFKEHPIAAHITLTKGERSQLATLASEIL